MNEIINSNSCYIIHYGIKGQKWNIRRFQNLDGTYTEEGKKRYLEDKRLDNMYKKESRKLEKYNANADIETQRSNLNKYRNRAAIGAAIGAAGGAAGLGLARSLKNRLVNKDNRADKYESGEYEWHPNYFTNKKMQEKNEAIETSNNSRNSLFGNISKYAGIGVTTAGFGYAVYNAIKANMASKRLTEIGHSQAVYAAKQQMQKMEKIFANTKYEDLVNEMKNEINV